MPTHGSNITNFSPQSEESTIFIFTMPSTYMLSPVSTGPWQILRSLVTATRTFYDISRRQIEVLKEVNRETFDFALFQVFLDKERGVYIVEMLVTTSDVK